MNRHYINNFILVVIILLSSTLLTGCAGYVMNLSSQSIQLSEQEAQSAYEGLREQFEGLLAGPYAYYASASCLNGSDKVVFYQTEEYQVAYAVLDYYYEEPQGIYLWYEGALYWYDGYPSKMKETDWSWRNASWDTLRGDEYLEAVVDCGFTLLQEEPEQMEYLEYPRQESNHFQLSISYPLVNVAIETDQVFADITAWWDKDGSLNSVYIRLNRPNLDDNGNLTEAKVWTYEDSMDYQAYQAERKVWTVGHDLELCDTPVPALTTQQKDRTWCEKMIESMDFEKLQMPEKENEDWPFPSPYTQLRVRYIEGEGFVIE